MKKVSFIGSGNVATHLAKGLFSKGVEVYQVFSKSIENAEALAEEVDALAIQSLACLNLNNVDVLIISVKDDLIGSISDAITTQDTIVVHTSGTKSIEELGTHEHCGVFYPLQTFSKQTKMSLDNVPFCIEANSRGVEEQLVTLASMVSTDVRLIDEEARKNIHVAAVIACNFSNHLLAQAQEVLAYSNQDLSILKPLMVETISKAFQTDPKKVQTGPAARGDLEVIKNHMERLESNPELQKIYSELSNSIIRLNNE